MPLGSTLTAPSTTYQSQTLPPPEETLPPPPDSGWTVDGQPVEQAAPPQQAAPVSQPEAQATTPAPSGWTVDGSPVEEQSASPTAPVEEKAPVPTLEQVGTDLWNVIKEPVNITEIPGKLGEAKDIVTQQAIPAMGGDILPWRRASTNMTVEEAYQRSQEGRLPPEQVPGLLQPVMNLTGGNVINWMSNQDPAYLNELKTEGYTSKSGVTFAPGDEAIWEAYADTITVPQRAFQDLVNDPTTALGGVAGLAKKTSVPLAGKVLGAADDILSLGVGPAIEGGVKVAGIGLRAAGVLAPTATQVAKNAGEAALESSTIFGGARREAGQLTPTVVDDTLAPGVFRLTSADPNIPSVTYKTDGRQVLGILDDPADLSKVRPYTQADHTNLMNLASRLDPNGKFDLVNTGLRSLNQPEATVARPYLQTLQRSLPATKGGAMRGAVPVPTSGVELITLRGKLMNAVRNGDAAATTALETAARNSNLLPPTTAPGPGGVIDAIGVISTAMRTGVMPIEPATLSSVSRTLRGHLDARNLGDVGLTIDRAITNMVTGAPSSQLEGQYLNGMITLATDLARTNNEAELTIKLADVLNHETVHAVKHFGLFRDPEWKSLAEYATRTKARGDTATFLEEVTARYEKAFRDGEIPALPTQEQMVEESVAEMARAYFNGTLVPTEVQRRLLDKIVAFFTSMAQAIRGDKPGQVLGRIQSGEIGARQRSAHISTMAAPYTSYRRNMSDAPIATTPLFSDPRNPASWNYYEDRALGRGWHLAVESPEAAHATLSDLTEDLLNKADPLTGELKYDRVRGLIDGSVRLTGRGQQIWEQSFLFRAGGGPAVMAEQINQAAELTWRDRSWYEKTVQDFKTHYDLPPETEAKTYNVTSATSGQTQPKSNVGRTLSIMSNWLRGADDFTPVGGNRGVRSALTGGEEIGSDKFGSFARTFLYLAGLSDEVPKATIDLQMMRVFGMPNVEGVASNTILSEGETGQQLYDFFSDYMEGVRDLLNAELSPGDVPWQTWQVQATLWSAERQRLGVQGLQQADDAGIWFKNAADWMRQQGIIGPADKVTAQALADPRITAEFGETNDFWQNAPWFTLESRTTNTPQGAEAGAVFERLFAIPVHQLDDADLQRSIDQAIGVYRGNERRALKTISEGSGNPIQSLLRGITGRGGLKTSMIRNDALGAYEGQIGVNMRMPLQSSQVSYRPGVGPERMAYNDQQIRSMLSLTSLGMDQSAAAASHFRAAPLGQHNTWTVRIPSAAQIEGNARLEQALANFTNDIGWPTSIHYDPSGILVDMHVFDPSGLPAIERVIQAADAHLSDAFGGIQGDVIPRARSDYFLEAADYRQPIRRTFDEIINPLINSMESHLNTLRPKVGRNARPDQITATTEALSRLKQARNILYTDDVTPDSVTRTIQEINDAVQSYKTGGSGKTPGAGTVATKRLSSLEQGWNGIRSAASQRDADAARYASDFASLADRAEQRTVFGAEAARPNLDAVQPRPIRPPGPPVKTNAGTSYSVAKSFRAYHGSPRTDLTILSPDPPVHMHRTGSTLMGSFVTGDRSVADQYARQLEGRGSGGQGRLYNVDVTLENPHHMTIDDFARQFEWEDDRARADAMDFKQKLIDAGHDGIIVWKDRQYAVSQVADNPDIAEAVLFKEVPVYSVAKGQSGVAPTKPSSPALPGIYNPGSAEEYLGTLVSDFDRGVLDLEYSFSGRTGKVWQQTVRYQDEAEAARDLAIRKNAGTALTPKEESVLTRFKSGLGQQFTEMKGVTDEQIGGWSDSFVDGLAGKRVQRFVEQATGLRNATGDLVDPGYYKGIAGRALKAYDNFAGFRRTMSLYSTTRGPAYVLMQAIGNAFTLGIANPSALGYYSPIEQRAIVKNLSGKTNYEPEVFRIRNEVGLGKSESLGGSRDQLSLGNQANKTFFERSTNPVVRGIGKIVAHPAIKANADGFDTLLRHAAWRSSFDPGYTKLVQDLPGRAAGTLADFAARTGSPARVGGDDFAQAIRGLGPTFTPGDLRAALTGAAPAGDVVASRAADRVARDYVNDLRSLDRLSIENVNRVGFDFAETRADAVLSRVFMFHYWMSRASVLYLTEAAKNPYQLQLWSRAISAGNNRAEAGIPEWQKNWQEFMATPAGIVGLWNPVSLIGTFLMMREDSEMLPWQDMTKLGQSLQTGFVSNLMLNPLLQGAIYVTGAGGSDFKPPDLLGTGKWTGDLNTWLEKANRDVATFYATEKGNPKVVPNIDGRTLLNWVGDQITQRGWQNDFFGMAPVNGYDPNRGEQADLSWLIHDQVLEQNPELADGTPESAELVASMVEEALANPDSDLYQSAAENLVNMQMAGPGSGRGNAFLDIAGYYGRMVLPFGITAQPTSRREKQIRSKLETGTELDKQMGYVDDATPEKQAFDLGYDAVNGAWTPEATQIKDIAAGIKNAEMELDAISIDGRTWTNEELAQLPAADRKTLSDYWLAQVQPMIGDGTQTGRQIRDAGYAAQEEALAEHPEIKDYWAMSDYLDAYPGGPLAGIEDTAAINSNYRRFLEQLPGDLTEAEYIDEATSPSAYAALTGQKFSRYDANPMGAGKGRVAGLEEGESLSEWQATQEEEADGQYLSKKEKVDAGLETFDKAATILSGYDELWGLAPGTLASQYASEIAGGGYASDQIYGILSDEGMTSEEIRPRTDEDKAAPVTWYLKWATENGVTPGQEVDRYVDEDNRRYLGGKVADINAGILSDPDPEVDSAPVGDAATESPTYTPPGEQSNQWWQGVGNALGTVAEKVGNFIGGRNGEATTLPPSKPAETSVMAPAAYDVVDASDGIGVQSTRNGSDRTWMEKMIGPDHAAVTTEYKGPTPNADYSYQIGHAADATTHAAYDISCDDPNGDCTGTPMTVPMKGKVVCAGYGAGTGEAIGSPNCTYSQGTTLPGQAHTIVIDVGTDPEGNTIQLSFNHMGTSELEPGQQVDVGDPLGTMGNTDAGPHVHLEGWGRCPGQGYTNDMVILDPQLIVGGYYNENSVCP